MGRQKLHDGTQLDNQSGLQGKAPDHPASVSDGGFTITIEVKEFVSHRSWRGGKLVYSGGRLKGSIGINYQGESSGLRPPSEIERLLPESPMAANKRSRQSRVESFDCEFGNLNCPPVAEQLSTEGKLLDQVMLAIYNQVSNRQRQPQACLAPWQERKAKELIASNLDGELSIARLAAECGLSRSYFSRAFHGSTGMSPQQWRTHLRIEYAKTLLGAGAHSIAEVALDCGFSDQAHLARVFSRLVGLPPSQWRRANGG